METLKKIIRSNWLYALGAFIGGLGGYLYWYYVGCLSGACPLKATPTFSIVWGTIIGVFIVSLFKRKN
ncbi:hypothetical protein D0T53_12700 [Dysgonomonas sp. 216]|uniref:hypothetical protein n=1 Tax=Dysgonomonas sp. 216 TaxID=2302934 RepID=UPI0013D1C1C1|nr:hypothetical protein [Dysgonomonas sp. 216]NDW19759.1 hypothetical protein [Dysgonomonas sp. 216]